MVAAVSNYQEASLLLVEDDDVDALGMERALKKLRVANPVYRARDGVQALEMLRKNEVPKPRIVLLDLNLPRLSGHDVLGEIRNDAKLKNTVVFVLTTSSDEKDKKTAYEHNVAGYVVKRGFSSDFIEVVTMLDHYWRVVTLPVNGQPTETERQYEGPDRRRR